MSYRCEICRAKVPPKGPQRRARKYRRDGSIEREYAVCGTCFGRLAEGVTLDELSEIVRKYGTSKKPPPTVIVIGNGSGVNGVYQ